MTTPITIDWVSGEGFVARDAAGLVGRGTSLRLAWEALNRASDDHYQPIWEAAVIKPPPGREDSDPWLQWAGTLDLNDPAVQEWQRNVEEYRRQCDREAGIERPDDTSGAA